MLLCRLLTEIADNHLPIENTLAITAIDLPAFMISHSMNMSTTIDIQVHP